MALKRRAFMKLLGLASLAIPFVRVGSGETRPGSAVPVAQRPSDAGEYRGLVRLAQEPQKRLNRLLAIEEVDEALRESLERVKGQLMYGGYPDESEHHFRSAVRRGGKIKIRRPVMFGAESF